MKRLKDKIKKFVKERDWEQYHSPKNLAIGLSVEASELLEIFTWLSQEESFSLSDEKLSHVKDEVGDILIYLVNFCGRLDIDPVECALSKIKKTETKYPVSLVKGKAKKYNEY